MPDEFYNLAQKKVGNKTEPNWGIKLKLDIVEPVYPDPHERYNRRGYHRGYRDGHRDSFYDGYDDGYHDGSSEYYR